MCLLCTQPSTGRRKSALDFRMGNKNYTDSPERPHCLGHHRSVQLWKNHKSAGVACRLIARHNRRGAPPSEEYTNGKGRKPCSVQEGVSANMSHQRTSIRDMLRAVRFYSADNHLLQAASTERRPFDRAEIAARFRAVRQQGHLTQAELAVQIAICRQSVSEAENCRVKPHASTWLRFLDLERRYREGAEMTRFLQSTRSGLRFSDS
jgi:DNA-binding XRE family transcriptional regulator